MPRRTAAPRLEALLAHQNSSELECIAKMLRQSGLSVRTATSGRRCLQLLRERQFDLIVSWIDLGDGEAFALAKLVRTGNRCVPSLPMIIICEPETYDALLPIAQYFQCRLIREDELEGLNAVVDEALSGRPVPSLLLVEKDPAASQAACKVLEKHFRVEVVRDRALALEAWRLRRHQLIVVNLASTLERCENFLKVIKAEAPAQPVLVITPKCSADYREELTLAGATDVREKPFPILEFPAECERLLNQSALLRAAEDTRANRDWARSMTRSVTLARQTLARGQPALAGRHIQNAMEQLPTEELTDDELTEHEVRVDEEMAELPRRVGGPKS